MFICSPNLNCCNVVIIAIKMRIAFKYTTEKSGDFAEYFLRHCNIIALRNNQPHFQMFFFIIPNFPIDIIV